jgi:ATP-dependent helicase/nuclease subunit B
VVFVLNSPRRHFLPWDRPLLPQAVSYLAGSWAGGQPLDLARTLVVVPTRQSGRRLREALAEFAGRKGSAAFPPRVVTPEALIVPTNSPERATRIDNLVAWTQVFRTVELTRFREVFPLDPPARNFTWALRLAEQFSRLQSTLAAAALRISDVAPRLDNAFPEYERWVQLGQLEQVQCEVLRRVALASLYAGKPESTPLWMAGIERIVLLGTPDPLAAAISAFERIAGNVAIEVLVHASEGDAAAFDGWGRPLPSAWKQPQLLLPDFEQRVHLCADPAAQAQWVATLARTYAARATAKVTDAVNSVDGLLAIGVGGMEILPLLEGELARARIAAFNPEGRSRRSTGLYYLLSAIADVARDPSIDAVATLVRCPDFLDYLVARCPQVRTAQLLADLDKLQQGHLPADLAGASAQAGERMREVLGVVTEIRSILTRTNFPENVVTALATVYRSRDIEADSPTDAQFADAASAWMDVVRQCARTAARFPSIAANDGWELALRVYGDSRLAEDKPAGAVDLQGWLELLFEDVPHLVVAGFNDGTVPEAVTEDAFLPDSLRARLGLKTNAARFARDAYVLSAIAASRKENGRLDLLFGKVSAAGDPLRPSRLLLQCSDEELPKRVAFLFRPADSAGSHLPWTRAWRLQAEPAAAPSQVAVTALRRWLECPFRFYLKYVRRMETVDAAKSEMDAFDFGTLCHTALEAMSRERGLRDCQDADTLRNFLWTALDRDARAKYGGELSLPLLIQLESARQRLGKVADLQARERAAGWITEAVETPFAIEISGLVVRGKIDRIDRHESTGAVRVLDYKTSDTAVTPQLAHLRAMRRGEVLPEWAQFSGGDRVRAWVDLQLPLYRHALAAEWGSDIACGYINLPKAVSQTALTLWDDYTPELHVAAMRCAEGVCAAIRRGEFWPPNELIRPESDDFAMLFHRGVAESVAWASHQRTP